MALYMATPKTADVITEVATGTAIKTLLQVATPSTTDIRVYGWGVSFEGIIATGEPGEVTLGDFDVAATVTTLTPEKWGSGKNQNSLCVGGAALTGFNATAEGTITDSTFLDAQKLHPQTGYSIWFPSDARPLVAASRFLRIRVNFAADIGAVPWILWGEPA